MKRRWIAIILGSAVFLALAILAVLGALFFAADTTGDARHAFTSPSGQIDLYLVETCEPGGCTHQAVIEVPGPDLAARQIRCGIDIEAIEPVFINIDLVWTPNESGVLINYQDGDGRTGSHALDFERDCNA